MKHFLPRIILVGPPNSGKTTLFNWLTGLKHKTVNYPGSTVSLGRGQLASHWIDQSLDVIDTPGTYSLTHPVQEEHVTVDVLNAHLGDGVPLVSVLVLDSSRLVQFGKLVEDFATIAPTSCLALTMADTLDTRLRLRLESVLNRLVKGRWFWIDGRLGGGVNKIVEYVQNPESLRVPSADVWKQEFSAVSDSSTQGEAWDRWVFHRVLGWPLFLLIMGSLFYSVFWAAAPAMELIDFLFSWLSAEIQVWVGGGVLGDFLSRGVIQGFGAVLVFVPQIAILFLGLTLLEDSGYLARAAALTDRPLLKIGMTGKSFVPLMSGFACAIPAIMAARTVGGARARLITILVIPVLSCSARLPVFALLLALLFPGEPGRAALILTGLYLLGLVSAALAGGVLARVLPERGFSPFLMDVPPYRWPRWKSIGATVTLRTKSYVVKAGPTILMLSIALWALTTFPNYNLADAGQRLQVSWAAGLGRMMEPILSPMGADWRVGVGLVSAFAAREVFVSALAILFHVTGDVTETSAPLLDALTKATLPDGSLVFTTASVSAVLVFFVIALQCMSTLAVMRQELNSWRLPLAVLLGYNLVAYALAVLTYQMMSA